MKFTAFLAIFLFSFSTMAQGPTSIEEANEITCKGLTFEGDRYTVSVYYTMDPTWTQQAAPFSIQSGKRAFVSITVQNDTEVLYRDALYTNDMQLTQTEDSQSLQFQKVEIERDTKNGVIVFNDLTTDFLNISMVAEQPSAFDFELKDFYGDFDNAQCAIQ